MGGLDLVLVLGGFTVFVLGYSAGAFITVRRFDRALQHLRKHIADKM